MLPSYAQSLPRIGIGFVKRLVRTGKRCERGHRDGPDGTQLGRVKVCRSTSRIKNNPPVGPYSRPMPRVLARGIPLGSRGVPGG